MIVDKDVWNYFREDYELYLEELELKKRQAYLDKIKKRFMKISCPICQRKNLALNHYCLYCGSDLEYSLDQGLHQ